MAASDLSLELALPGSAPARETELLARSKSGDHQAYASLVRPHERAAYRVAVAITGLDVDAEEAMQNGFVKAYCSLHRFRTGSAFRPWLLRIVVNEAHNVLRDRRRHAGLGARAAEHREVGGPGPDEVVMSQAESDTVLAALGRLSKPDRLVLALRYFAELPDCEAAALARTSTKTYRVRLVRARRRLQRLLEDSDD